MNRKSEEFSRKMGLTIEAITGIKRQDAENRIKINEFFKHNEPIETYSDIGSLKFYSEFLSVYISNGYGDGENKVWIANEKDNDIFIDSKMVGSVEVKKDYTVFLSRSDIEDVPAAIFESGKYFINLFWMPGEDECREREFIITKWRG